jgi:hypothetical protein
MREDLLRLHETFLQAELTGDTAALTALLAEDFRSIGEQGYVLDKEQWLGRYAEFHYLGIDACDVDIVGYPGAAVIRYVQQSRSVWRGNEMALDSRVGQTWVALPGGWRLAAIQFSSYSPT